MLYRLWERIMLGFLITTNFNSICPFLSLGQTSNLHRRCYAWILGHKLLFIRTFNISISIFSHNPTGLAAVLDQKLCSWISSPSFLLEHQPGHHGQPFYIRGLLFPVVQRRSPSSPSPQTSYFFHEPEEKNHLLI